MKRSITLVLLFLTVCARLSSAHDIQDYPIYYPDREYKEQGWKVPNLSRDTIAMVDGKEIGREDYIDWLVIRADKEYLFEQFMTAVLIGRKAKELGVSASEKETRKLVNARVDKAKAKAKSNAVNFKILLESRKQTEREYLSKLKIDVLREIERFLVPSLIINMEWDIPEASIKRMFNKKYGKDGRRYKLKQLFFSIQKKYLKRGEAGYAEAVAAMEEKAEKSLEKVLDRIKAGEDFGKLAELYSDDEVSKYEDGYRGKYVKGKYGLEFDRVIPALAKGEVSGVIKSRKGFHIVKIMDKQGKDIEISHIQKSVNYYSVIDMALWEKEKAGLTEKIEGIMKDVKSARDFIETAGRESEDYNSVYGLDGADGWENTWDMILGNDLRGLGKGDISGIIEADRGLHVVMIEDMRVTEYNDRMRDEMKKITALDIAKRDFAKFKKTLFDEAEIIKYLAR